MIVHALRFGCKEGTSAESIAEIEAALSRLASSETVSFSVVGRDLGNPADGFELAYCVAFEDLDALEHYMLREPAHRAADFAILPHVARLSALDLTDDPDPELGAKIAALAGQRLENDPEFAALMAEIETSFVIEAS